MMHKKRWAAFVLAAALVLTGCSAGSFLHFGKGSGGSTVQKIDRPAVESAELQFAHPAAGDTIAVFDTSAGVFKAMLFPDKAPQAYDNFAGLVQAGYYNGLTFSRVESGFVVEAGQGADGRAGTWVRRIVEGAVLRPLHGHAGAAQSTHQQSLLAHLGVVLALQGDLRPHGHHQFDAHVLQFLDHRRRIGEELLLEAEVAHLGLNALQEKGYHHRRYNP